MDHNNAAEIAKKKKPGYSITGIYECEIAGETVVGFDMIKDENGVFVTVYSDGSTGGADGVMREIMKNSFNKIEV